MDSERKNHLILLAVILSVLIVLSYAAPISAMKDDDDKMDEEDEGDEEYEEDEEHKKPCHSEEEVIDKAENDESVKESTENYSQTEEVAYYSNENEDEWHVEISDNTPTEEGTRNKTVAIVDDKTGEIKKVVRYTAPTISEGDAEDIAEEEEMGEFLEEHPESEVWASYNGSSGKWMVTAYDVEKLEKRTVMVDDRTREIHTSSPTIDQDNAVDMAVLEPVVDNFLGQYAIGIDNQVEWEEGVLENVEVSDDVLVLSRDSLGYTEVGSKRDDTNLQSAICGSLFTAPSTGKILEITAYAYYFGGTNYRAGLYRVSDNSFIAETRSKRIRFDHTGWETFEFSSSVSVSKDTDYFVVLWDYSEQATRSIVGLYYDSDSQQGGYQVDTSGGSWPDSWAPEMVGRKYSIYATYDYHSGRYTSEWHDLEEASPFVEFTSKATITAADDHKITVNVQVSDDESTVKDNILLNLGNGVNTYDISTLANAKYVRITSFLSTGSTLTSPVFHSFSIITGSDLSTTYENVSNQWRISFKDKTGVNATVRVDAASGEVQETEMFSWKEAIEEFEEVMEEHEEEEGE